MRRGAAQVHTHEHTQRYRAKLGRNGHGKDARIMGAALEEARHGTAATDKATERKHVFRPILASPFAVHWPRLPKADGDVLLHTLVEILVEREDAPAGTTAGINAVTRTLEARITSRAAAGPHPRFLFVCEADMDPATLLAHIPMLVGSYNAACAPVHERASPALPLPLMLVPLPRGAALMLATALRVRRLAALLIDTALPPPLLARLEARALDIVRAQSTTGFRIPWLEAAPHKLAAPRIKHLATSAPVHFAQAKAAKKASRKANKARRAAARCIE
ncbi:ribonuclease P [Malassezia vespertilionis]|uniref:Pop3p n=1 Tax=Malassezia vespertilionis TaxID=2020962 RepID=A0A2N1JE01_9BASI|nr:ribonuclease P [Malassezia vespertilionis]PKI84780.1 hypothetical protein MVES_000857 [Malassezia vespertilionis]WFD05579.1 ribonuclease P [Malassezia vespertilionis]